MDIKNKKNVLPIMNYKIIPNEKETIHLDSNITTKPLKTKMNRCLFKGCKAKVSLIGYSCRCISNGGKFCANHRMPEDHSCTFDYKTSGKELLKTQNEQIKANKINII
tara:strand:+ start:829 stop:1152 length:324 start_codon:yes stop_codon:yes gene_type:complete